jgi:hypothetical protein
LPTNRTLIGGTFQLMLPSPSPHTSIKRSPEANDGIKETRLSRGQLHIPTDQGRHGGRLKANAAADNLVSFLPYRSKGTEEEGEDHVATSPAASSRHEIPSAKV